MLIAESQRLCRARPLSVPGASACAGIAAASQPAGSIASTLVQISRSRPACRFTARWQDLVLSVETASHHWRMWVQDSGDHRTLYSGQRISAEMAKAAAIEFVLFHLGQPDRPEELARGLAWQQA